MPLLFSYGTLQDESVQREVFGRTLTGRRATLLGFEEATTQISDPDFVVKSGKSQHAILRCSSDSDARVEGMVFEVSQDELEYTDRYEPIEYTRVLAEIASGGQAWVYVDSSSST